VDVPDQAPAGATARQPCHRAASARQPRDNREPRDNHRATTRQLRRSAGRAPPGHAPGDGGTRSDEAPLLALDGILPVAFTLAPIPRRSLTSGFGNAGCSRSVVGRTDVLGAEAATDAGDRRGHHGLGTGSAEPGRPGDLGAGRADDRVPHLQSDPPRIPGAIACGADRGHRRTAAARARPDVEAGGARQRPRTGTQIPPSTCTPTSPSSPASSAWTTPPWTGRSPGCSSSAQTATARSGGSTSSVHPPTATPCSCGSFTTHGRAQDVLADYRSPTRSSRSTRRCGGRSTRAWKSSPLTPPANSTGRVHEMHMRHIAPLRSDGRQRCGRRCRDRSVGPERVGRREDVPKLLKPIGDRARRRPVARPSP
jgi:hypothetical protein